MKRMLLLVVICLSVAVAGATIRHVPSQYPTIQAGINAANAGDTVLVADGTYTGIGNKDLDFLGKAILVTTENGAPTCIIDCENDGRGFYFHTEESSNSILSGFKIINGRAEYGGGIYCDYSSPTIDFCQISNSIAEYNGGGICINFADPLITNCIISSDSACWDGGGIFSYGSRMTLQYCKIIGNHSFFAGGLWCENSDPLIEYCNFRENTTTWDGGGILVGFYSNAIIRWCVFERNTAWRGGGVWCHKSNLLMENCLVQQNFADCGGGIISYWQAEITISNCTVSGNSAETDGGGIHCSSSNTTLVNTIVTDNTGNGGIYFDTFANAEITFGDFHHNENGDFTGNNIPPGLGVIGTLNANGDSCDAFNNIFEDPLFENPGNGNFQLTWGNFPVPDSTMSPCIDAGDPGSPADPDSTFTDIGAFYFDQGLVIVTLRPDSLPVVIPAGGGSFGYDLRVLNRNPNPVTVGLWSIMTLPDGQTYGPILEPVTVNLRANSSQSCHRVQTVPSHAPVGLYQYICYLGNYPHAPTGSDFIVINKLGSGIQNSGYSDWSNTGEEFIGATYSVASIGDTTEHAPPNVTPNPFNPTTAISFKLQAASHITLKVFDTTGRLVTTLVDGWRDAGMHEVTFDGSNLPSGMYLYTLQAGGETATGKMLLLK